MRKISKTLAILASCIMIAGNGAVLCPAQVMAADNTATETKTETKVYNDEGWLRARAVYKVSDMSSKKQFTDATIELSSDKWKKGDDGWYYYADKVKPDQSIEFMKSFTVPEGITSTDSDKKFGVEIEAQVAEAVADHPGWSKNEAGIYTETYDTISKNYTDSETKTEESNGTKTETKLEFTKGTLTVKINEYEDYGNGVQGYEDNQTVLPGQKISKIVKLDISGALGKATKTTTTTSPKTSTSTEAPKSNNTPSDNKQIQTTAAPNPQPNTGTGTTQTPEEGQTETPTPPVTFTDTGTSETTGIVNTGDDAPIVPLMAVSGIALAGATVAFVVKKREEKNRSTTHD